MTPRRGAAAALLLLLAPLGGCGSFLTASTATGAGIAGAGIAGAISKDATIGAAIGLGVAAGANAGLRYVERDIHNATQDSIAAAAAPLAEGDVTTWHSKAELCPRRGDFLPARASTPACGS